MSAWAKAVAVGWGSCFGNVSGRIALVKERADLSEIIKRRPVQVAALLRTTKGLTADDMARLARLAQRARDK
jgi:hypothetical protein